MKLLVSTLAMGTLLAASTTAAASPPDTSIWKPKIDEYFQSVLKDPYSAVINVVRGPRYDTFRIGLQTNTGWGVCYSVNAKNSYGGYTGAHLYFFVISEYGIHPVSGDGLRSRYAMAVTEEQIAEECSRPADDPEPAPDPKAGV